LNNEWNFQQGKGKNDLKNDGYKNISVVNRGAILRKWNSNANQANETN
jgi:hypothetical protein